MCLKFRLYQPISMATSAEICRNRLRTSLQTFHTPRQHGLTRQLPSSRGKRQKKRKRHKHDHHLLKTTTQLSTSQHSIRYCKPRSPRVLTEIWLSLDNGDSDLQSICPSGYLSIQLPCQRLKKSRSAGGGVAVLFRSFMVAERYKNIFITTSLNFQKYSYLSVDEDYDL